MSRYARTKPNFALQHWVDTVMRRQAGLSRISLILGQAGPLVTAGARAAAVLFLAGFSVFVVTACAAFRSYDLELGQTLAVSYTHLTLPTICSV